MDFCYRDLIEFVEDRPGHDRRYAIDFSKIKRELGWEPRENLSQVSVKLCNGIWRIWNGADEFRMLPTIASG